MFSHHLKACLHSVMDSTLIVDARSALWTLFHTACAQHTLPGLVHKRHVPRISAASQKILPGFSRLQAPACLASYVGRSLMMGQCCVFALIAHTTYLIFVIHSWFSSFCLVYDSLFEPRLTTACFFLYRACLPFCVFLTDLKKQFGFCNTVTCLHMYLPKRQSSDGKLHLNMDAAGVRGDSFRYAMTITMP